jgi:predicted lipid-binding transport protein (Tim44 family)
MLRDAYMCDGYPDCKSLHRVDLGGTKQDWDCDMSGNNEFILTLVFLGLAVFLVIKLRSILGARSGFERPPEEIRKEMEARRQMAEAPQNAAPPPVNPVQAAAEPVDPADRWKGIAKAGTPLASGLDAVVAADASFEPRGFVLGARQAYEMLVQSYSKGDRKTLKTYLGDDVFQEFQNAINDRESRGETAETTFVSIDKADIVGAEMRGKHAHITVSFLSKLISATRDKAGLVVDGSADKVIDVNDVWTFARDVSSRDPNWRLVATENVD